MIEITTRLALNNEPINADMEPSLKIKTGLDELAIRKIDLRKMSCEKLSDPELGEGEFFSLYRLGRFFRQFITALIFCFVFHQGKMKGLSGQRGCNGIHKNAQALFDPELSDGEFAFT